MWTKSAVELLERCKQAVAAAEAGPNGAVGSDLLALDSRVSDCNSAFFDVANDFAGCIAGCHEVLRRQGLLEGNWCLDPQEGLGPGQQAAIDRVLKEHAISVTTPSSPPVWSVGWHERCRAAPKRSSRKARRGSAIEKHDTPANIDGIGGEFLTPESVPWR